jgi:hypothetical protein
VELLQLSLVVDVCLAILLSLLLEHLQSIASLLYDR